MLLCNYFPLRKCRSSYFSHAQSLNKGKDCEVNEKPEVIIITVPKKIKTNALRNLADATCILLVDCLFTA